MRRTAALTLALCGALAVGAPGCGGGDDEPRPEAEPPGPGAAGTLELSVSPPGISFDPMTTTGSAALIARQVTEPLVSYERAPYGSGRRGRGPAAEISAMRGGRQWSIRLRAGVGFHDGEPLDGGAVLANVSRWLGSSRGRGLLGSVIDADSPRPDLVRFFCNPAVPDLDERLASRRLGLVSPSDITPGGQTIRARPSGAGPFEFREGEPGRLILARNVEWWGTRRGLGPAFDQLRFAVEADELVRADALRLGSAGAVELAPSQREQVRLDPLLTTARAVAGIELGVSRSLRAVGGNRSLAGAWPTTAGFGGR